MKISLNCATCIVCCLIVVMVSGCDQVGQSDIADKKIKQQPVSEPKRKLSHFIVGTGSVQGLYFPISGVICRLLNRHKQMHKMRCSVESTAGSVYNLKQIQKGNFDLVVAQSDWQYHAYHGSSTFSKAGPNPDLRAVFALEADPIALIVRADSDFSSFEDLRNNVVSFGYSRSLQHRAIRDLLKVKEWDYDQFKAVKRLGDNKQISALCRGEVDSILLLTSSLNDHIQRSADLCDMKLLAIDKADIKKVIQDKSYYRVGIIPQGQYFDSPQDTLSFGLGATFVALEQTSPKAIYHIVKEVVENFKDFQSLHPSLQTIKKKELPYAGISAPLHPGAKRYYKEARLLK